jgi:glycosyltransferase, family 1
MKVILINDCAHVNGGGAQVAISTAIGLKKQGVEVFFFAGGKEVDKRLNDAQIPVYLCQEFDLLSNPNRLQALCLGIWNFRVAKQLKVYLRSFSSADTIVHLHSWSKVLSASIFPVLTKGKFRIFITLHDFFYICPNGGFYNYPHEHICKLRPMSRQCWGSNCDARNIMHKYWRLLRQMILDNVLKRKRSLFHFITISQLTYRIAKKYLGEDARIINIGNPVLFTTSTTPSVECIYYTFVGRLSKEKGVDLFCRAITQTGVKGCVIGDGELYSSLKAQYPNILFTGWLNGNEKQQYIQKTKVLVLPSLLYETFGLTVAEVKSCGIPSIVAKESAAYELIEDGITGLSYTIGDLTSLCSAISRLENGTFSYNRDIIIASCQKVNTEETYAKQIIAIYKQELQPYQ